MGSEHVINKCFLVVAGVLIFSCVQPAHSQQTKKSKSGQTVHTQYHVISTTAGEHGMVSPPGNTTVIHGGQVGITITPDEGWRADSVIVDGLNQGTLSAYVFTNVSMDHTFRAVFRKIEKGGMNGPMTSASYSDTMGHIISTTSGAHGHVSPAGNQHISPHGKIDFSIKPDTGYAVDSIMVDGGYVGSVTSYSFTNVMYDHVLVAKFSRKK